MIGFQFLGFLAGGDPHNLDAGADYVDVRIPTDLSVSDATMTVLDNGSSMDEKGLRELWHIAFSPKRGRPIENGRKIIGKFGIGKLATYALANELTYICKPPDGIIRRVTMDFGRLDELHRDIGFSARTAGPNRGLAPSAVHTLPFA